MKNKIKNSQKAEHKQKLKLLRLNRLEKQLRLNLLKRKEIKKLNNG